MPVALLALAIGGFGIGLTEFVIMGLLPEVADDFAVTETTAGYLISGYALSVAVGAIVLTLALTRVPRKTALLGLMVLFVLGNLISALAPDYATMMTGRVVAALCHGAFFGIGAVVAAQLVAPSARRAPSPSCSADSPSPTCSASRSAPCSARPPAGARPSGPSP